MAGLDTERLSAALPGYEIGAELGRGAFGVVVAGVQRTLGRQVAVKALPADLAGDEGLRRRFNAEARLVASLDHPHVVRVFDYVEQDDLFLLVMELLPGGNLDDRVESGPVSPQEASAVLLSTAGALHYAHQRGILHRDVKPANVMFAADGTVKLGDFGIAKVLEANAGLTATGSIMGTPAFMAPEQALGSDLGPATDVYAAGVMLYQLLAGRLPFEAGGEAIAQLYQHVNQPPHPLSVSAPDVPRPVAAVVHRALEKDPGDRYATAEEFGVALAGAATAAFGSGWLDATGIPVLTSGPLSGALERVAATDPEATIAGIHPVVRPDGTPTAPRPAPEPLPPRGRRTGVLVAVVLAVLAVVGGAVFLLADGGDDSGGRASSPDVTPATEAPDGSSPSDPTLSGAQLDRFRDACEDRGVPPDLCGCVADAAVADGLAPDPFDAAIDQIVENGGFINGLDALFDRCATA